MSGSFRALALFPQRRCYSRRFGPGFRFLPDSSKLSLMAFQTETIVRRTSHLPSSSGKSC